MCDFSSETMFFIYIMLLAIMLLVCFDYMLSKLVVIIMLMYRITERSIHCLNGLSRKPCISVVLIHCFAYGYLLHSGKCG